MKKRKKRLWGGESPEEYKEHLAWQKLYKHPELPCSLESFQAIKRVGKFKENRHALQRILYEERVCGNGDWQPDYFNGPIVQKKRTPAF
jgi:hypothetical protein